MQGAFTFSRCSLVATLLLFLYSLHLSLPLVSSLLLFEKSLFSAPSTVSLSLVVDLKAAKSRGLNEDSGYSSETKQVFSASVVAVTQRHGDSLNRRILNFYREERSARFAIFLLLGENEEERDVKIVKTNRFTPSNEPPFSFSVSLVYQG